MKTCAFTGHRPSSFIFKYNEEHILCQAIKKELVKQINAVIDMGVTDFYSGCALGVDIWAGEAVCKIRDENPNIRLIGAVPFKGQEARWNENDKERYNVILSSCDEVVTLYERPSRGAFLGRDRYMVDNADVLIAVYDRNKASSGTGYTVRYAMGKNKPIIIIDPNTLETERFNF